jgi:hypothetical protein
VAVCRGKRGAAGRTPVSTRQRRRGIEGHDVKGRLPQEWCRMAASSWADDGVEDRGRRGMKDTGGVEAGGRLTT